MRTKLALSLLVLISPGIFGCAVRSPATPPGTPITGKGREISDIAPAALDEAEALYQRGIDLYRAGSWQAAATTFERTLDRLIEDGARNAGDYRLRRSAALLEAKLIYYRERCISHLTEIDISPPPPPAKETPAFSVPFTRNAKVERWLDYFQGRGRTSFDRWLARSGQYKGMIEKILGDEGIPTDLLFLAMIESGMNPNAYSRSHAVGTWQFISGTGRLYGLKSDWWYDDRRDTEKATLAAARHLKDLYESLGDWYLVLAAYNCGEARVRREIRRSGTRDFWLLSRLPRQTRDYVPKFLAALEIGRNPEQYGFFFVHDPAIEYETIEIHGATSLEAIAHCSGAILEDIEAMNPAIRRSVTPPTRPSYFVHVPPGTGSRVQKCLLTLPREKRVTWEQYRVRNGDTISEIAGRFGTSSRAITDMNKIRNSHRIRAGQKLLIPRRTNMAVAPPPAGESRKARAGTPPPPENSGDRTRYRYLVRSGDTLSEIAVRFDIGLSELRNWNGISRSSRIRAGENLSLFLTAGKAANFGLELSRKGPIIHVVRRGESLDRIGRRYGVPAEEVARWNGLGLRTTIFPGNRLKIYTADTP